jgi:hypothetical protein
MLQNDLKQLLLAFNAHGVEYLVVGGYAVGIHAEPRATKDLDVFIRADAGNSERVYRALIGFGAPLAGVTSTDFCDDPAAVFQIGQPPFRIDILQQIDGVSFDEAWPNRIETLIDGLPVPIISAEHLIRNKLASGRLRHLADAVREATKEKGATLSGGCSGINSDAPDVAPGPRALSSALTPRPKKSLQSSSRTNVPT